MAVDPQHYVGRILAGGYRIERFLASGGFAWVYLGATGKGERCALKVPHVTTEDGLKRFVREAKVLRELPRNPHCVGYCGDGQTKEGLPFLAMEFVDGVTLTTALETWPVWPPEHACALMMQLCAALSGLHALGLANRDVKPDNVMLTREWQVKLMDFGLVKDAQGLLKLFESEDILAGRHFAENIDRGMLAGSPEYMAPEQFTDSKLEDQDQAQTDTWTDVYSLGLIFHQILTGRKLFPFDWEASDQGEFARKLLAYLKSRLSAGDAGLECPDGVPDELWKVVARALRHNPKARYRTATDMAWDLDRYIKTGRVAEQEEEATSAFDVQKFLAQHGQNAEAAMHTLLAEGLKDPTGEWRVSTGQFPMAGEEEDTGGYTQPINFAEMRRMYNRDPHDSAQHIPAVGTAPLVDAVGAASVAAAPQPCAKPSPLKTGLPTSIPRTPEVAPAPRSEAPPARRSRPLVLVGVMVLSALVTLAILAGVLVAVR